MSYLPRQHNEVSPRQVLLLVLLVNGLQELKGSSQAMVVQPLAVGLEPDACTVAPTAVVCGSKGGSTVVRKRGKQASVVVARARQRLLNVLAHAVEVG